MFKVIHSWTGAYIIITINDGQEYLAFDNHDQAYKTCQQLNLTWQADPNQEN